MATSTVGEERNVPYEAVKFFDGKLTTPSANPNPARRSLISVACSAIGEQTLHVMVQKHLALGR
jgi:hypothetical protein